MICTDDRVAIISGAGSGIGKAIAIECSKHYPVVCLVGRSLDKLESVAESARESGAQVQCYRVDLTSCSNIKDFVEKIGHRWGHVDVLVHSAGIFSFGRIEKAPLEEFDRQFFTNVRGPYYLTQLLLPLIRKKKGQIVFINSSVGLTGGRANISQYAATKQALKAVTDSLREEVNSDGMRIISVYPGRTATPMQREICRAEGNQYQPEIFSQPDDIAKIVLNALSVPRSSEVTDIVIRPMKKVGN
jgi:NADP-dependent 3-hydroxy acid dehydrogenase YdfG